MRRVLLTGGRAPVTLDLSRLFHQQGWQVFVADSLQPNLAGSSRTCFASLPVPPPAQQPGAFVQALAKAVQDHAIDLLIPTCEEVYYVAWGRDQLDPLCDVFTTGVETLARLHSKFRFIQLLQELELPYPQTRLVADTAALAEAVEDGHAYVLKPEFSRFSSQVIISGEAPRQWQSLQPTPEARWVYQQYLEGPHFCSYSVARAGRLMAHSVYPVTYSAGRGAAVYFESRAVPAIETLVTQIVRALGYTGQIAFDFIQVAGQYIPIECNPRATSGIHLFTPADDLPQAFNPHSHREVLYPSSSRPKALSLAMLLYCGPRLRSLPSARAFWQQWRQAPDVILDKSDFGPWLAQFRILGHYFLLARQHGISVIEASTRDIEWNGVWPA